MGQGIELGLSMLAGGKRAADRAAAAAETATLLQMGLYAGTDLTVKFAGEIAAAPYSGDVWAWIKGRIDGENFSGIHTCDWIPFTADGHTYHAQVAGIDTCKGYGDIPVGSHIDFITKELWHERHRMNYCDYNNGRSDLPDGTQELVPWMMCELKYYLNNESGYVVTNNSSYTMTLVDYTDTGVFGRLPAALRNVIIQKHTRISQRYVNTGRPTDDTAMAWRDIGKLWLPSELETYGIPAMGTLSKNVYGTYTVQYPIFAHTVQNRGKNFNGTPSKWWLIQARSGDYKSFTGVNAEMTPDSFAASSTDVGFPICFRIG